MKLLVSAMSILFLCSMCSCSFYGQWTTIGYQNSPFISKNTLAIKKERSRTIAFDPISGRMEYQIIFTDGASKSLDYYALGWKISKYIMKSGLYEKYEKLNINCIYFNENNEIAYNKVALPDHEFIVVSIFPIIVLMIQHDKNIPFKTAIYEIEYSPFHRTDAIECRCLVDYAVSTGNKVPYSDNIYWFNPEITEPPKRVVDNKIESNGALLMLRREQGTVYVTRQK